MLRLTDFRRTMEADNSFDRWSKISADLQDKVVFSWHLCNRKPRKSHWINPHKSLGCTEEV